MKTQPLYFFNEIALYSDAFIRRRSRRNQEIFQSGFVISERSTPDCFYQLIMNF